MNNTFIPQAVDIVKQAIDYDNLGEYERALQLYQKALEYFITGLKYEQNPASKKIISDKVAGYMNRAEEIKKSLADSSARPTGSGGAKTLSRDDSKGKDSKEDDEKGKLRGALSSAILSEKPNVKWDDVAGLEGAKEALKEAVILPTRFPQVRRKRENREFILVLESLLFILFVCFLVIYWKAQALERNLAVWPTWNRKVVFG